MNNAKHLFLTLIFGLCSVFAWSDDILVATDVISSSTIVAKGYHSAMTNQDYNAIAGLSFVTDAQYSASSFYLDYTEDNIVGIENGTSFATSKSKTGGKIVSVSLVWKADDDYNNDGGKAVLKLYARDGSPYTGSENAGSLGGSELQHTFTYEDGVYTFDLAGDGFDYVALVMDGANYGAFLTSISIKWQWVDRTEYTIGGGTIVEGTWGTEVTASTTTAYAGDLVTVTFAPKMTKKGAKRTYYSLTSYAFDGMEFDLSCGTFIKNPNTYTITFPMPARNVLIDAVFEVVEMTSTTLLIDKSVTQVGSAEELVVAFTHLGEGDVPVPGYDGMITAVADDGTILGVDNPVKVSDGHYTFTVHGKAVGTTTVTVTAPAQGTVNGSFDNITITVIPREIALVAQYGGEYYAMKNSLVSNKADGIKVFYNSVEGNYFYETGTDMGDLTWNASDPSEDNYHIQNPNNSDKFLTYYAGKLKEETSPYEWWKNGDDKFTNVSEWGIVYNGSSFLASSSMTSAAVEALISDFRPMTYTTASGAGIDDARTLSEGKQGTICVPFNVDDLSGAGAEFYELTGKVVDGDNLAAIETSDAVSSLEAGHSYIFKMKAGQSVINLNGSATFVSNAYAGDDDGFVGCLPGDAAEKIYVPSKEASYATDGRIDGCYVLSNGALRYVQPLATASVKHYRAYINAKDLPTVPPAAVPLRRAIFTEDYDGDLEFGTDEIVTSINELSDPVLINWNEPVYNIMGIRVGNGATGLLIQNGRKFLIQ